MPAVLQNKLNLQVRNFAFRLIIIAAVLLVLGRVFGTTLVAPLLPALAWVIDATDDRFRVDQIYVVNKKNNTVIQFKITPTSPMIFGTKVLMPKSTLFFEPTILAGSVLQPIIVFLAILLAWTTQGVLIMPMRILLAVPMGAALFATNTPLAIVGALWDFREYVPNLEVHPLVYWNDFLQTGGPLVMAIAGGTIVVSVADRWSQVHMGRHHAVTNLNP